LNKENLWNEGRGLIRDFLIILQTYKSSGCIERGEKFYAKYSEVSGDFLKIRDIVIETKKPRRVELNNNLVRYNEKVIEPIVYPETLEGIIYSFADRFPCTRDLLDQVIGEWSKTKDYLRVN